MDLASNLLMLLQDCCLGLGPNPTFVVILMLTVAAPENPGTHTGLCFQGWLWGEGIPSNTHRGAGFLQLGCTGQFGALAEGKKIGVERLLLHQLKWLK